MGRSVTRFASAIPLSSRTRSSLHRLVGRPYEPPTDTTSFPPDAPSSEVTELFQALRLIPGWFTIDDCAHFSLVLSMQTLGGIRGNLLEIGSYHGRSTALLGHHLRSGEELVVVDAFEQETDDAYADKPSPDRLLMNIKRINPKLSMEQVRIVAGYSDKVDIGDDVQFRFCHIDGGHSRDAALFDLELCAFRTLVGGVLVLDDYRHPRFPGVAAAADEFLRAHHDFSVLADLNRHGAKGRKLYIQRLPVR